MSDEYSKGLSYNGWQPLDFLMWDMPGKGLPCLHEQVFAPLRTVLDACHWHAAPFAGQRTATGFAWSCPQYPIG